MAHKIIKALQFLATRTVFLLSAVAALCFWTVDHATMKIKMLNRVVPSSMDDLVRFSLNPVGAAAPDWGKYILYFSTAAKVMPGFSASKGMLGYCYYHTGDFKKAEAYLREATRQNPNFFWFHYNLAVLHFKQHRYGDAVERFKAALNCRPEDAIIFINVSKVYRDLNRLAQEQGYLAENGLVDGYRSAQRAVVVLQQRLEYLLGNELHPRIF